MLNIVTYNILKIETVFFSKFYQKLRNKQLQKVKIKIKNKKILFNKDIL